MGYSRSEMETTIVWDDAEKVAHIYAASPISMRKLDKLCEQFPDCYKRIWVENGGSAAKYEVPARFIKFGKPASAAQLASAARMRSALKTAQ